MLKNKRLEKKWLEALRSGDYQHVQGKLCDGRQKEYPDGWCCLGVLKNEYALMHGIAYEEADPKDNSLPGSVIEDVGGFITLSNQVLSHEFRDRIGLSDIAEADLINLNDDSNSFRRVINYIEKEKG